MTTFEIKGPTQITPAFAFSYVERALREGLSQARLGADELAEIRKFFPLWECVYCGSSKIRGLDHLVSVRSDGETVLGNMVPACGSCDDSKGSRDFESWMFGKAKCSPASRGIEHLEVRAQRLRDYKKFYGYAPRSLEMRLTEAEVAELREIRLHAAELKKRIANFLSSFLNGKDGKSSPG
jgi:hypothetical protein